MRTFSFQLLIEFFFSGMITLVAILIFGMSLLPSESDQLFQSVVNAQAAQLGTILFVAGLVSYYLGTTVNAVSNAIFRARGNYRVNVIKEKLGISDQTIYELTEYRKTTINRFLPPPTKDDDEGLKEIYASARNFAALHSNQAANAINYHWGFLRLARATLLPLLLLLLAFAAQCVRSHFAGVSVFGFFLTLGLGYLTYESFRYREKFLIYTVFDILFLAGKEPDNGS